jgi:hypothetical protein
MASAYGQVPASALHNPVVQAPAAQHALPDVPHAAHVCAGQAGLPWPQQTVLGLVHAAPAITQFPLLGSQQLGAMQAVPVVQHALPMTPHVWHVPAAAHTSPFPEHMLPAQQACAEPPHA